MSESLADLIRRAMGKRLKPRADVSRVALTDKQYAAFRALQSEAFVFAADFLASGLRRERAKDRFFDAATLFVAAFAEPRKPKRKR